jgi:hypothetical protein
MGLVGRRGLRHLGARLMKQSNLLLIALLAVAGYFVWKSVGSPTYSENLITNVLPPGAVQ